MGSRVFATSVLSTVVLLITSPAVVAQGRPDILWMRGGHSRLVLGIAYAGDGLRFASIGLDGTLKLWRASDGQLIRSIQAHAEPGDWPGPTIAWSQARDIIATAGREQPVDGSAGHYSLKFWRAADGALLRTIGGLAQRPRSLSFSPDGTLLASEGKVWRVDDGAVVHTLPGFGEVAFTPDGDYVLIASYNGELVLHRLADGLSVGFGCNSGGNIVAVSGCGRHVAVGDGQGAKVFDPASARPLNPLGCGPAAPVLLETDGFHATSVAFSDDGDTLAVGGNKIVAGQVGPDVLEVWNVAAGIRRRSGPAHDESRYPTVAFSPDGGTLASGVSDIKLWRVADNTLLRTVTAHTGLIRSVAFTPDASMLATASVPAASDSPPASISFWQTTNGQPLGKVDPGGNVDSLAISPAGDLMATVSADAGDPSFHVWRLADSVDVIDVAERTRAAAFSPDGELIVTAPVNPNSGDLKLWRSSDGAFLGYLDDPYAVEKRAIAFSRDGQFVAGAGSGVVVVWRVADGTVVRTFPTGVSAQTVDFGAAGDTLIVGGTGAIPGYGAAELWRISDAALVRQVESHPGTVRAARFAPDGQSVATVSDDGVLRFFRASDGALVRFYDRETGGSGQRASEAVVVLSLAYSGNGQVLALGRGDGTAVVLRNPLYGASLLKAVPVVAWDHWWAIEVGTPLDQSHLNARADVPGTFTYYPAAGTLLPIGVHRMIVVFTPADLATYNRVVASAWITVSAANIARSRTTYASPGSSGAGSAVDGDFGSEWSADAESKEWLLVDLGAQRLVTHIRIHWGTTSAGIYAVAVSADARQFTPVFTTATGSGCHDDIGGLALRTRFVLLLLPRTGRWGADVAELEVFGQ